MSPEHVVFVGSSACAKDYILEMAPNLDLTSASLIICPHIDNNKIYLGLKKKYPAVRGIVDGTSFEEGEIYVFDHEASSDYSPYYGGKSALNTSAGRIILENEGYTINPAMESLSKVYEEKMIAVILSGCGEDGAQGSKVVKESGGKILVQREYDSRGFVKYMPEAAIDACGSVDFVGDIKGIMNQLNLALERK
jgi:chemotaxis response regulator CheB